MQAKAHKAVEKKRRLRMIFIIFPGVIGLLSLIALSFLSEELYGRGFNIPITILAIAMFAASAIAIAFTYLQTGFRSSENNEYTIELGRLSANDSPINQSDDISIEIENLRSEVEFLKAQSIQFDIESKQGILEALRSSLLDQSTSDLIKEAQALLSDKIASNLKASKTHDNFDACRQRLLLEIDSLGRRGNLNLGVGAVITLLGLAVLGVTVFYEPYKASDIIGLVSHYLPRLSLIILIEVFAYFFLSLYKAGLSEIKYFQNEVTNIEAKQIALQASFEASDNVTLNIVVAKLSDTERNHILSKDQTTVELEKAKLESESKVAFGKFVADFFQKVKP